MNLLLVEIKHSSGEHNVSEVYMIHTDLRKCVYINVHLLVPFMYDMAIVI